MERASRVVIVNTASVVRDCVNARHNGCVRRSFSVALFLLLLLAVTSERAFAGSDKCAGGGFTVLGLSGKQERTIPASSVGSTFLVKGKYVEFTVDAATFGIRNWTLTGAPNDLDITGGSRTVVFASKIPDHRGLVLNSSVSVNINQESLVLSRTVRGCP